jgi:hypothetical protein
MFLCQICLDGGINVHWVSGSTLQSVNQLAQCNVIHVFHLAFSTMRISLNPIMTKLKLKIAQEVNSSLVLAPALVILPLQELILDYVIYPFLWDRHKLKIGDLVDYSLYDSWRLAQITSSGNFCNLVVFHEGKPIKFIKNVNVRHGCITEPNIHSSTRDIYVI